MSIIIQPLRIRPRRKRAKAGTARSTAPVLTSATYVAGSSLTLVFDRAIDISAIDASAITVDDGATSGMQWQAENPGTLTDADTVTFSLLDLGPATGSTTLLTAGATNNITSAAGGGAWEGVTDLQLPYS